MNIHQTVPRIDCNKFAKCGEKSLAHCRQYRGTAPDCAECLLIHRKPRNRRVDANGVELKQCTSCGKWLPLFRFYKRISKVNGKEYHSLTSDCRMCKSTKVINQRKSHYYGI